MFRSSTVSFVSSLWHGTQHIAVSKIDNMADEGLTQQRPTRLANRGIVTKINMELEKDTVLQDIKSWN